MSEVKIKPTVLGDMLGQLADKFEKERKKEKPYKNMFKAGTTCAGLLKELDTQMTQHVLDACTVLKERKGIELNKQQYHMLLALPFLANIAEQNVKKNEGWACYVDKAFYVLSEQLIALGKEEQP